MAHVVASPTRFPPQSPNGYLLARHRDEVLAIAERYGVTNIRVFGSTARGDDEPASDIDLLVDLPPQMSFFTLEQFQIHLFDQLGAQVDVVPGSMVKPVYAEFIFGEAVSV